MGGAPQAVVQRFGFDPGRYPVRMRATGAALTLHEVGHATGPEATAHLAEGLVVNAHDLAGAGEVAQFVGTLQQAQLARPELESLKFLGVRSLRTVENVP